MISPFDKAVKDIIAVGQHLDGRGLAPATSGNYSVRLKDGRIAVTVSGRHKGKLTVADVMLVDAQAKPLEAKTPSAETELHAQIYALYPEAGAILHVHSLPGVVLTRDKGVNAITLERYEMLKAFPGITTHDVRIDIPVVDNSQDMNILSEALKRNLKQDVHAYLIRDHGFYVWGRDMAEAERIAEALEYLLTCELELKKCGARS